MCTALFQPRPRKVQHTTRNFLTHFCVDLLLFYFPEVLAHVCFSSPTAGAIKEEDKAKQAVGGVQLVRLSFPPVLDIDSACRVVENAVATIYKGAKL